MWEWLFASIDPLRIHSIGYEVSWHARLMLLSWSFLVPIGIISARFFKILPWQSWPQQLDNQIWWVIHLTMQYASGILMVIAIWLIWDVSGQQNGSFLHHFMGWATLTLCGVQYLAGWLRGSKGGPTEISRTGTIRGDHFDMTQRRIIFEQLHKTVGYICLATALVAVFSGLWLTNAPRWMWIILSVWWLVIIAVFVFFQKIFGATETYESIWGDDPELPGNKIKSVGWGIKKRR